MTTTTAVIAHGDVIQTVFRHLPIWLKYSDNLLIISPQDNPCIINNVDCRVFENRSHFGLSSIKRQLFAMISALDYGSDYYVFLEYDAIMLSQPKQRNIFQGLWKKGQEINKETGENIKKNWIHYPWIFPHDVLKKFVEEATDQTEHSSASELGNIMQDIWIYDQLKFLKMDIFNLYQPNPLIESSEGFSRNTIELNDEIEQAINCIKNGGYAFHGIKTENVLRKILDASN